MTEAHTTDKTAPETAGRLRDGIDTARDAAAHAFEVSRDKATHVLENSRETAAELAQRTAQGVETNPLGILVGGIAIGALIGALIPRSDRERALLAPIGKRIGDSAKAAALAAKEAGQGELETLGLTKDSARTQVKTLFEGVVQAAGTAASAAAKAAAPGKTAE